MKNIWNGLEQSFISVPFYKNNKPILAICRGFQLIADIYDIKLEKINNHIKKLFITASGGPFNNYSFNNNMILKYEIPKHF